MERMALRMTYPIKPSSVIDADCVHDENISLPASYRVTHPQGMQVLGMLPSIRVNLAHIIPKKHQRAAGPLNDLHP